MNYPKFIGGANGGFAPLILNGVEVKVVHKSGGTFGDIRVQVSKNKVDIDTNYRMAAKDIVLMNITN